MTVQLLFNGTQSLKYTIIVLIMLATTLSAQAAANSFPVHNISINFDLEHHQMNGVSHIELQDGSNIELHFDTLRIASITINGQNADENLQNGSLVIASSPKAQVIEISYSKTISTDPRTQNSIDQSGIVLTDIWHPTANQDMLFHLTATIPSGFSAISEADEIITFSDMPETEEKKVIFRFPHPLRVIHFIAGHYLIEEESFSDGKILSSYFFPEDQDLAASYRKKARSYLARYEKLLGPYPYKRFTIVENRFPTGFAMPTFTLLGQSVVRLPFIKDTSLGHEVLHSWFGNGVRVEAGEGNWAEGLTAYLADHTFSQDQNLDTVFRKEQLIKYESHVQADNSLPLRDFTGAADELPTKNTIRAIGYSKSSMFFHMLKKTVGEDVFQKALQDFYARMKYQTAVWADLLTSFEKTAGITLEPLFNQWLTQNDIPAISAEQLQVVELDGQPLLTFQIVQPNSQTYKLTVPITIITTQGPVKKNVTVTDSRTLIDIPLSATPTELIIDSDYDLMRRLNPSELPPTWSRFTGATNKLAIMGPDDTAGLFGPFLDLLKEMDCRIIKEEEVTNADLTESSLIFLGTNGSVSRSLFSQPLHPQTGMTVDIRNNPLNPVSVAVLVSGENHEETTSAVVKLKHYGKYSYLHFEGGRIQDKRVTETESGQKFALEEIPSGIATQGSLTFPKIIEKLLDSRVIYVGETHTSYEDHILQLRIIRALYEHDPRLAIGMEMFSKPSQPALDDYIEGRLDEKKFLKQSNYFMRWSFDYRLYRDIINFARHKRIPIIALNLEKEIVSKIFKEGGTYSLSQEEIAGLVADRDLDMPNYRERLAPVYHLHSAPSNKQENNFSGFLQAQALWDETMAESVAEYLAANPDDRVVVLAGRGHALKDSAIPPRVYRRIPVKQAVVLNTNGRDIDPAAADFLFFSSPESLQPPALLGVMLEDTDKEQGAKIVGLSSMGQAESAGIKEDDIIIALDGEPIETVEDVKINMLYKENIDSIRVLVKRSHGLLADEELEIEVLLAKKSPHRL